MTEDLSKSKFVMTEKLQPEYCQKCGNFAELRPYGIGGLWICFKCGMSDKRTTETMFKHSFKR